MKMGALRGPAPGGGPADGHHDPLEIPHPGRAHRRPDPKTAETIMVLTGKVVKEKGLTALMVTHSPPGRGEGGRTAQDHPRGRRKREKPPQRCCCIFNRYSVM